MLIDDQKLSLLDELYLLILPVLSTPIKGRHYFTSWSKEAKHLLKFPPPTTYVIFLIFYYFVVFVSNEDFHWTSPPRVSSSWSH